MSKPTIIISALLLIILSIDCCQPNYQVQNIETGYFFMIEIGIANFQNTISDQQSPYPITYLYPYFTLFLQTPQIAFAINNLQNQNVELSSFYITIRSQNISQVEFLLVNYQSWNLISVNFIIALRNDIYLDSNQLNLSNSANSTFQLQIKKIINPYKSIARVFLNGFVLQQPLQKGQQPSLLNITIDVNSLLQRSIQVTLSGSTINSTKSLWFSYMIFEPEMAGFASYGGRISKQNFQGIQSSNLHTIIYRSQYKLFGLNGIQMKEKSLGLISSINSDFVGTVYSNSPISSLTIDYVILGVPPNRMCNCQDSSLKYAYLDDCLNACPNDTYVYQYKDGSFSCLKCNANLNMRLNSNRTGCDCKEGYQFTDDGTHCVLISFSNTILIVDQSKPNTTTTITSTTVPDTVTNRLPQTSAINPTVLISNTCLSQIANSYFDGTNCYCKPGFKNVSSSCVLIAQIPLQQKLIVPIPLILLNNQSVVNFTCPGSNQILIDAKCQCQIGFQKVNNICVSKLSGVCGYGQYWDGQNCACVTGFVRTFNNICAPQGIIAVNCSENQINNGLGYCICKIGYYNVSGKCISEKPCPLNSIRLPNDTCVCNANFISINGDCAHCPQNQIWLQTQSRCVFYCGINALYNQITSKCQCIPTFALSRQNTCQYCPPQKFIVNNYCVSCQINQFYNSSSKQCICKQEYYLQKNGICVKKCPNNQFYDSLSMACKCQLSLGRFNGVCQVCPDNYFASKVTQQCVACSVNQVYLDGQCVCNSGFAPNQYGVCIVCGEMPNTFFYKGECATCPGYKIYNGNGCVCPSGSTSVGLKCVQKCKNDQLMSDSGDCYKCPINQVVMNSQCVCRSNYQRINSICQLICPIGAFLYQGRCATCPPNKIYNTQIKGCVCQNGYYLNLYNQCERLNIQIQTNQCPVRKYIDLTFGCMDCSPYCLNCTNSMNCVKCQLNFLLENGKCQDYCGNGFLGANEECDDQNSINGDGCSNTCRIEANFKCSGIPSKCVTLLPQIKCGNGIIQTKQQCDDSNTVNSDGCSSTCTIQRLYTCYGQPSVCKYNSTANTCGNGFVEYSQQCDDAKFNLNDGCDQNCKIQQGYLCVSQPSICTKITTTQMILYTQIKYNINNIYISLQTDQKYQFGSESEMQNFIKFNYSNITVRPSTYCQQRDYPDLDVFDCLLLFSSGIPNRLFQAEFSYSVPGIGTLVKLMVNVDPLAGQFDKAKLLKRN